MFTQPCQFVIPPIFVLQNDMLTEMRSPGLNMFISDSLGHHGWGPVRVCFLRKCAVSIAVSQEFKGFCPSSLTPFIKTHLRHWKVAIQFLDRSGTPVIEFTMQLDCVFLCCDF